MSRRTIYDLLDAKHLLYRTTSGITLLRPIEALMTATTTSSRAPSTIPTPNGLPLYTVVSMFPLCSSTLIPPNTKLYDANNTFADHVKSDPLPEHSYLSNSFYADQPSTGAIWLNSWLDLHLPELEAQGTLVVATFDEITWQNNDDYSPNNDKHVEAMCFGASITPGTKDDIYITTYGLLGSAIQNFSLGSLGRNHTNATSSDLILSKFCAINS
ncbi:uncharacterized protein N7529_001259 [Penicillium soppii]|uniref:uncharacterized protein n=1 Tax=Penicillium soppii TaxID=69789 RepID=UPI002549AA49|nr:uncharacterized protein N7529_001259 [Penicillium soppii]KAJ5882587.1 hypothetical protein N7529_001259 [Penicillium soppii]